MLRKGQVCAPIRVIVGARVSRVDLDLGAYSPTQPAKRSALGCSGVHAWCLLACFYEEGFLASIFHTRGIAWFCGVWGARTCSSVGPLSHAAGDACRGELTRGEDTQRVLSLRLATSGTAGRWLLCSGAGVRAAPGGSCRDARALHPHRWNRRGAPLQRPGEPCSKAIISHCTLQSDIVVEGGQHNVWSHTHHC